MNLTANPHLFVDDEEEHLDNLLALSEGDPGVAIYHEFIAKSKAHLLENTSAIR